MADVAELVGDHEPDLGGREVLQQVVVEHDALRVPEAVHVGVGGGRAPRGVDLVHLADVDPRPLRQRQDLRAQPTLLQRRELVEQRVEHDRRRVGDGDAERDDHAGSRDPPARPEAPQPDHQQRAAGAPTSARRSPATWPRRPPSRPSSGSPARRPSRAASRSPRAATWRGRAAPRSPPRRPRRSARDGARPRRAAAREPAARPATSTPSSTSIWAPYSHNWPLRKLTAFSR